MKKRSLMLLLALLVAVPSWSDDKEKRFEKIVPCVLAGDPAPPQDYLGAKGDGWQGYKNNTLRIWYSKSEYQAFISFREPAMTGYEIKNRKKEDAAKYAWQVPEGKDAPPTGYSFIIELKTGAKLFAQPRPWDFEIIVLKNGKETKAKPAAVAWERQKPDMDFFDHFFHNHMIVYSGIPYDRTIEKVTLHVLDCAGEDVYLGCTFKYGKVPKIVESRDSGSGMIVHNAVWE